MAKVNAKNFDFVGNAYRLEMEGDYIKSAHLVGSDSIEEGDIIVDGQELYNLGFTVTSTVYDSNVTEGMNPIKERPRQVILFPCNYLKYSYDKVSGSVHVALIGEEEALANSRRTDMQSELERGFSIECNGMTLSYPCTESHQLALIMACHLPLDAMPALIEARIEASLTPSMVEHGQEQLLELRNHMAKFVQQVLKQHSESVPYPTNLFNL